MIPSIIERLRTDYHEKTALVGLLNEEIENKKQTGGDTIRELYDQNGIPYDTVKIGEDEEAIAIDPDFRDIAITLSEPIHELVERDVSRLRSKKEAIQGQISWLVSKAMGMTGIYSMGILHALFPLTYLIVTGGKVYRSDEVEPYKFITVATELDARFFEGDWSSRTVKYDELVNHIVVTNPSGIVEPGRLLKLADAHIRPLIPTPKLYPVFGQEVVPG